MMTIPVPTAMASSTMLPPMSQRGASTGRASSFSIESELRHVSMVMYAVPGERVKGLIPPSFKLEETMLEGRRVAWVSVTSFRDRSERREESYEQTSYAVHVTRNGEPGQWVLGISLGSLSAVASRNLWPLPWHLSAMELDAAFAPHRGGYAEYRLRSQSEWANASWILEDSAEPIRVEDRSELPDSMRLPVIQRYFLRRDGLRGAQRLQIGEQTATRGRLRAASCDLLERLGILSREELQRPHLVSLCPAARLQAGAPVLLGEHARLAARLAA